MNGSGSKMNRDVYESICKTKKGVEESFKEGVFYDGQTRNERHLEMILESLKLKAGMRVLDLGTGTGFLAFPMAERWPGTEVVGLDIVEKALDRNRKRVEDEEIGNLKFVCYDGVDFPFGDGEFDLVVSRYALHHFPEIEGTFLEISRVLKAGGRFFLSDQAPNEDDERRFVDEYMQMKKDGHIKFYTKDEWLGLGKKVGLIYEDGFETSIRFPKKREMALEFDDIVSRHDDKVMKGYDLEIVGDEIWITEKVNNLTFRKSEIY